MNGILSRFGLFFAPVIFSISVLADGSVLKSPDGKVRVNFRMEPNGVPTYEVDYLGKPIVLDSRLGVEGSFTNGLKVVTTGTSKHSSIWTNEFGELRLVPDNYRELDVDLQNLSGERVRLTFRAYNEGAAFRYSFPGAGEIQLSGEHTEFRLPAGTYGYEEHGTEGEYRRAAAAAIQPECERPLTLEYADGLYACVTEAANENYPRMLLSPLPDAQGGLVSALGGRTSNTATNLMRNDSTARLHGGDATPWRVIVVGKRPGDLLERNYLVLNLNRPCALADTSWIRPGKVMRDMTLTTTNARAIIDFAAMAGLKYIEFDWRWYGHDESLATGDATVVRAPGLNLPEIVSYAKTKNVGVILYVDRKQIKTQRDTLFALFEKWGIQGVKIGFVDVGPQVETAWITETIQKAAEHHLVLDIHDGYRTTGLARTYPNLLTVEGIRGNEHMPTAEHNCTLSFTRYIAGTADYTVCYYTSRKQTTFAHQLAMAVVSFSPLQFIFWYDGPSDYHGEPEVEFFRRVPTVWDETRVLNGEIGKYATIARRSGEDWFIGAINGSKPMQLKVPLAFLAKAKDYEAHVYTDDKSVSTRTQVACETRKVNAQTTLDLALVPSGGAAIWITPVTGGK